MLNHWWTPKNHHYNQYITCFLTGLLSVNESNLRKYNKISILKDEIKKYGMNGQEKENGTASDVQLSDVRNV